MLSNTVWTELPAADVLEILRTMPADGSVPICSGFLDTHQWVPLVGQSGLSLAGGHAAAQFRLAQLGNTDIPLRFFQIQPADLPDGIRSAKQLRAWLYRAGMPNSTLGDIVFGDSVMLTTAKDIEIEEFEIPARLVKTWHTPAVDSQRTTAAGTRIDAVVSTVFKTSRAEAQKAIKFGFVFHNFTPVSKRSVVVRTGDQLVYRTKGRGEIEEIVTNPKSGREWVAFRVYPA